MDSLNKRIKVARKHAAFTQLELSEKIGVSIRAFKSYEKDASKVTVTIVQNIAHGCNVNEAWLLTGIGDMLEGLGEQRYTDSERSTFDEFIEKEHSEIIKQFRSKKEARDVNIKLVALDHHSRSAFKKAVNYIDALWDGVESVKKDLQADGMDNSEKQKGRMVGKKAVNGK